MLIKTINVVVMMLNAHVRVCHRKKYNKMYRKFYKKEKNSESCDEHKRILV